MQVQAYAVGVSTAVSLVPSEEFHRVKPSNGYRWWPVYIGHPYCITINPQAVIGRNVNIHRGVVIGQENRGKRKGAPTLGDDIWIGINASIVGGVKVGNDVMIAPGAFVNRDVPSHSVVIGNPCIIKHKDHATEGYINHKSQ